MTNKKDFTTSELLKVVDIKPTRLQQWIERGYVFPSVQVASGPGTKNIYSLNDLYRVAAFKQLVGFGLSRERASKMVKAIGFDIQKHKKLHFSLYINDLEGGGAGFGLYKNEDEIDELFDVIKKMIAEKSSAFLFNVTNLVDNVNLKISKLMVS